jgi:putative membrane protein
VTLLYLKSFHIIFVVTWFAGLFYIVRLFVYFSETQSLSDTEKLILQKQYQLMQRRLWYGITWPSAVLTLILGISLVLQYGIVPSWLWAKLCFVVFLYTYHIACHLLFIQQQKGIIHFNSNQLRLFNEVATIFLFAIVFLAVLKETYSWVYGLMSVAILTAILLLAIFIYKKIRTQ